MKYLAIGDEADHITRLTDYTDPSRPLPGFDLMLCGHPARIVSGATREQFVLSIMEVCRVNGVIETPDGLVPNFDCLPPYLSVEERRKRAQKARFGLRGRRAWKLYETTWDVLWPKIADQFAIDLRRYLSTAAHCATEL